MKKFVPIKLLILLFVLTGSAFAQPLTVSISSSTNVTCFGGTDGSAVATATYGTPPYTYLWSPGGQTTSSVSGLVSGSYTLTVTDAVSATVSDSVIITQPPMLSTTSSPINVTCFGGADGSIAITASGGTPPYTYPWDASTGNQTTATATALAAGSYTCNVMDANGCASLVTASVTQPPVFTSTPSGPSSICLGDTVATSVTASGGTPPYTYYWSGPFVSCTSCSNTTVSPTTTTNYNILVTDNNGCNANTNLNISVNPLPTVTIGASSTAICMGASATLTATGGMTYLWSTAETTSSIVVSPGSTTSYTVTGTDANGCSDSEIITITVLSPLTLNLSGTDVSCAGSCDGAVSSSVTGGSAPYMYSWSNAATTQNITNVCPGTYNCTVTDINGCTASSNMNITQPAMLTTSVTQTGIINCYGMATGALSAAVSGGVVPYSYSWSNGNTTPNNTNLTAGAYTVTVTDANGCATTNIDSINQPPMLTNAFSSSLPSCGVNDGSVSAMPTGGTPPYVYQWSTGNTGSSISNLSPGVYMVDITDANGCLTSDVAAIGSSAGPTISLSSFSNISCYNANDGMISVSISGGTTPYTVFWTDMDSTYITQTRTNLQAGPYEFIVADANGCQTVFSTYINEPSPINVEFTYTLPGTCVSGDGAIIAAVTGGMGAYTFIWSTAQTTSGISNLSAGVYTLTVTDVNGCVNTSEAYLSDNTSLDAIGTDVVTNCGTNTGSIDVTPLNGSGNYSYAWTNGANTEDISSLYPGAYGVTITDNVSGCKKVLNFVVESATASYAPEVCMVTVDTLDEKNVIIWERPAMGGIKEFVIYRETSQQDVYRYIGTCPIDSLTQLKDTVANTDLHGWKYKISAIDSCGVETGVSEVEHRPVFLTVDTNGVGVPSLLWTNYIGRPITDFIVKRNANNTGWVDVATVPSSQNSFVDVNCPSGFIEYTIEVVFATTCEATRGAINTSRSNIKSPSSLIVGLKEASLSDEQVILYPNPSSADFTVSLSDRVKENTGIEVVNALGQIIYKSEIGKGNKEQTINAANWMTGIYFVRINGAGVYSTIKFVKQ